MGAVELTLEDAQRAGLDALAELCAQEAQVFAGQVRRLQELIVLTARQHRSSGVEQFLVMEIAGTCSWGQGAAAGRLADAQHLAQCLPQTLALLEAGRWTVPAARTVLSGTRSCTDEVAREVERRLLAIDGVLTCCPAEVRRHVADLVLQVEAELDGPVTEQREAEAAEARRVSVRPEPDAMSSVYAALTAEQGRGFALGLDELARRQAEADRAAGVERTADQRRADLLAALPAVALHAWDVCGRLPGGGGRLALTAEERAALLARGEPAGSRVQLVVHVPLASALGLSEQPADLDGHGPLSAATARALLPHAQLRRLLVDARTGRPLAADDRATPPAGSAGAAVGVLLRWAGEAASSEPRPAGDGRPGERGELGGRGQPPRRAAEPGERPERDDCDELQELQALQALQELQERDEPQYVPSRPLDRFVRLRDGHCLGPGCSVPARACDLDHGQAWPLGPTAARNLGPLSRRCHNAKTHGGWRLRRDPDGSTTWTSPLGRTYRRAPPWRRPDDVDLQPPRRGHGDRGGPTPTRLLLDAEGPLWCEPSTDASRQTGPTTAPAAVPCPF